MIRQGAGSPLVLLHGVTGSERMWESVMPLLAPYHDTIAITAMGHRGGRPGKADCTISDVVEDVIQTLDELGLERPHLAGNSMGGWVAIELARRGRAASVCALSPAGFWEPSAQASTAGKGKATDTLRQMVTMTRRSRPFLPLLARFARVRREAMKVNAAHGDRIRPGTIVGMADDLLACTVSEDLFNTRERIETLDPVPCPIMLAWPEKDRLFPPRKNGALARRMIPGAEWRLLPDVGHVPMLDDPQLVAQAIRDSAARAESSEDAA